MTEIRFDDIEGLRARIRDEYGGWGPQIQVTQEMIDRFADLTRDRQWIHVDVERAQRESPFGGPIAHGFLTLSLVPALQPRDELQIVGHVNVTNYGCDGLRFLAPVAAGSTLHARTRLVAVEAKRQGTLLNVETAVHVVGNERPALVYKGLTLYTAPASR